jgi:hypothetical protein
MSEPTPHDRYVEAGHCPAVLWTKAWCNDVPGHPGAHWSLRQMEGGALRREYWSTDAQLIDG